MLRRLSINNYALIDVLDIDIPEHLVIITGDSGAGKSIMLGALQLLLGGKFDKSVIKDESRNCIVEAQFDDHIIRRVMNAAGRSRSFIDDEPATLEAVRELAAREIDIHSQNSQTLLSSDDFRLSVVDSYAGDGDLLARYRKAYDTCVDLRRRLQEIRGLRQSKERERDYIKFRYEQLCTASLKAGELEELEEKQKTLANAGQIKETLLQVSAAISSGEQSVEQALRDAARSLQKIAAYFPAAEELSRRIDSCRIELKDVSSTLEDSQDRIDASPEALLQAEQRIAQLYDLMHRNDAGSEEELIAKRDGYGQELRSTDDLSQQEAALAADFEKADAECTDLAAQLTKIRSAALAPLSDYLQQAIRELEIPQAQFRLETVPLQQRGRSGAENIKFLFSSTAAAKPVDLSQNASGGEISRIMLCIKSLLAQHKALPTVVFDEIDTGTSGSLADKMGRKIVEISKNIQVVAITHLPQVAAKGDAHYLVYKEYLQQGAVSRIRQVTGQERVGEIARMISGSSVTPEAMAAARVLLEESN
ncbi:MAG: AAA family ATPase [Bacteroidales bacterium]|nr:AAA family ATPase [Bacteroidales bacterium]